VLILLVLISFFFILNLKVTFTTPIAFGDEGFHTRLAQLIAKEKEYFVYLPIENTNLTKSTYNRPPLWNLLEASFFLIFGFFRSNCKISNSIHSFFNWNRYFSSS
jgi:4-amino-4-deoxy-L-arabinose transferase-like glycosyltransferase